MATKVKKEKTTRLARNFHRTFIPERQYVGAILKYAAESGMYDIQSIADATGIPTGTSSGKAIPTADYAIGMGLVSLVPIGEKKEKCFSLALSNFGRIAYLEDRFLQEDLTQWLAHLNLCNARTGAELWYQTFWAGAEVFGCEFRRDDFATWLSSVTGAVDVAKALSPTIRMYAEDASFAACRAIIEEGEFYCRRAAPRDPSYMIGYAAWAGNLLEQAGLHIKNQITEDDLETCCGFRSVTGWSQDEVHSVLSEMEAKGLVTLDRHMSPWIICFKQSPAQLWTRVYEEFI